jgi:hypothetical protein
MKACIILLLQIIFNFNTVEQIEDTTRVESFVLNLSDKQISIDEIAAKYFDIDENKKRSLKTHLQLVREELVKLEIDKNKIKIIRYLNAPEKMKNLVVDEKESLNLYYVLYRENPLFPVLIENEKITSFSTLDKGGRNFLINYK